MSAAADFDLDDRDGGTLRFSGDMTLARLGTLPQRLDSLAHKPAKVDLGEVGRMDTVGAWVIHRVVRDTQAELVGASPEEAHLLEQVAAADKPLKIRPDRTLPLFRVLNQIGAATMIAANTMLGDRPPVRGGRR
jgi:phospholipid/cholesterol/gamma-HCH transport system permease protein